MLKIDSSFNSLSSSCDSPKRRRKNSCNNCGLLGHSFKACSEPITSYGIIAIKSKNHNTNDMLSRIDSVFRQYNSNLKYELRKKRYWTFNEYDDIFVWKNNFYKDKKTKNECLNGHINLDYLKTTCIDYEKNKGFIRIDLNKYNSDNLSIDCGLEFLCIQRRHSLGFIEFIRGKYDINNYDEIKKQISLMVDKEIEIIKTWNFQKCWEFLWNTKNDNTYNNEFYDSRQKFYSLLTGNNGRLDYTLRTLIENVDLLYNENEWGFPKGRRNINEKDINCALREFSEETGLDKNNIIILHQFYPIIEIMVGTNGIIYRHIYYIALYNGNEELSKFQKNEVGDIKWFNTSDTLSKLRDYHLEKKQIISKINSFISTSINF